MGKVLLGPQRLICPTPVVMVGAVVNGKPNFMTVAYCGIVCADPPMISVGIRTQRYSLQGIRQSMTFSVNIPSVDQVKETDYCGIVSGTQADKIAVCQFKVFYGKLNVPLIEQCPINLECKVVHLLELGSHILVIGRVEETHVSENCFTDGKLDVSKVNPLAFIPQSTQYYALGNFVAKGMNIGKELRDK